MKAKIFLTCVVILQLSCVGILWLTGVMGGGKNLSSAQEIQGNQAIIPETLIVKRVIDLKEGEKGYVAPEAMVVDEERKCWINPYHVLIEEAQLQVKREKDGFHVEVLDEKIRWARLNFEMGFSSEKEIRKVLQPVRLLTVKKSTK